MTLASPERLWWLVALVLVVAAYARSQRRRRRRSELLAAEGLLAAGRERRVRRYLPLAFVLGALVLLAIAYAQPQASIITPRRQATLVVAIDVSNSMGATDATPTRLGAAKRAADAIVADEPSSVKIGVVAFGPSAVIVQPPSFDHSVALAAINHLVLGGGTTLSAGILTALDAIAGKTLQVNTGALNQDNSSDIDLGYYGGASIVLISDGEDTSQANPVAMARVVSTAGVHIETIGVGTTQGTTVKIDGFSVATAADPATLQSVAKVTNGAYYPATDTAGLAAAAHSVQLRLGLFTQFTEISALFAAGAGLLLVAGALLSMRWHGRVL